MKGAWATQAYILAWASGQDKLTIAKSKEYNKKREVLRLQYFYNKSWVISYYWFKFEFSTEITFLTQQ